MIRKGQLPAGDQIAFRQFAALAGQMRPAKGIPAAFPKVWDRTEAGDPAQTRTWFAGLVEADCVGGRLTLLAPSRFIADYVGNHHAARLLAVVSGLAPSVREVRIEAE